jgi:hypothetical protein
VTAAGTTQCDDQRMASDTEVREAARMLRALAAAVPLETNDERATARRIEGAAVALEVAVNTVRETVGSETPDRDDAAPRSGP